MRVPVSIGNTVQIQVKDGFGQRQMEQGKFIMSYSTHSPSCYSLFHSRPVSTSQPSSGKNYSGIVSISGVHCQLEFFFLKTWQIQGFIKLRAKKWQNESPSQAVNSLSLECKAFLPVHKHFRKYNETRFVSNTNGEKGKKKKKIRNFKGDPIILKRPVFILTE